ncbi:MAG: hypothetical protein HQL03_03630 [Nitrospirae bacterium]|nr:hypothetical protein [Nitrospirota bacterium]MBF0591627.1 hypothetical protein [Nitrospirota bacterium]
MKRLIMTFMLILSLMGCTAYVAPDGSAYIAPDRVVVFPGPYGPEPYGYGHPGPYGPEPYGHPGPYGPAPYGPPR